MTSRAKEAIFYGMRSIERVEKKELGLVSDDHES